MEILQSPTYLKNILSSISADKWPLAYEKFPSFDIHNNGTISIENNSVNHERLQEVVHQVVSSALDKTTTSIEQAIDRIISEIGSKDLFMQKVLTNLIFPLIVGLILLIVAPVSDYYIKKQLGNGDRKLFVKQTIKEVTSKVGDKSYLSCFRVVSVGTLHVRKSAAQNSNRIGLLYLGEVVEVLKKGRKWSLVKRNDKESETLLQGWVFSRYLKRIR